MLAKNLFGCFSDFFSYFECTTLKLLEAFAMNNIGTTFERTTFTDDNCTCRNNFSVLTIS